MSFVAAGVIAGVGAAVQIGTGIAQNQKAKKALRNLQGQPQPNYTMSGEQSDYYNRANAQSQYGFNPAQTAAFQQNVAQQQNTAYRQGINMSGGNMAQALSAGLAGQNLGAQNQFASDGAALQQQKFQQLGGVVSDVQGQYNLASGQNIAQRRDLEMAYGGAMKAGMENIMNGINTGAQLGSYGASSYVKGQQAKNPYGGFNMNSGTMNGLGGGYGFVKPNY